jgi:hypothetical protein
LQEPELQGQQQEVDAATADPEEDSESEMDQAGALLLLASLAITSAPTPTPIPAPAPAPAPAPTTAPGTSAAMFLEMVCTLIFDQSWKLMMSQYLGYFNLSRHPKDGRLRITFSFSMHVKCERRLRPCAPAASPPPAAPSQLPPSTGVTLTRGSARSCSKGGSWRRGPRMMRRLNQCQAGR